MKASESYDPSELQRDAINKETRQAEIQYFQLTAPHVPYKSTLLTTIVNILQYSRSKQSILVQKIFILIIKFIFIKKYNKINYLNDYRNPLHTLLTSS